MEKSRLRDCARETSNLKEQQDFETLEIRGKCRASAGLWRTIRYPVHAVRPKIITYTETLV